MLRTLADELAFELVEELERKLVFRRKRFFTYDSFHGSCVTANGIFGVLEAYAVRTNEREH